MPTPLTTPAIVTLADGVTALLCGGYDGMMVHAECYYYSSTNDTWTAAPSLNVARTGHGMAVYKGRVYAYGGEDANINMLSSVEMFVTGGKWQLLPFGL